MPTAALATRRRPLVAGGARLPRVRHRQARDRLEPRRTPVGDALDELPAAIIASRFRP
jgi:hypothetical protein